MSSPLSTLPILAHGWVDVHSESAPGLKPIEDRAPLQQPLAATLPPELLTIIFNLVSPHGCVKVLERFRQSLVCRSWYAARMLWSEYYVEGETYAKRLVDTFEAMPALATRATKLHYSLSEGEWIVPLLRLCPGLAEVEIYLVHDLPPDAIAHLPPSVRKLRLELDGYELRDSVPALSTVSPQVEISLSYWWSSAKSCTRRVVLHSLEPVLDQLVSLALADEEPTLDDLEPGYLEPMLVWPKLTHLDTDFWQVRPDKLAGLVAQLGQLEWLRLGDFIFDRTPRAGFKPSIVADVIDRSSETLRRISISNWLTLDDADEVEEDWSEQDKLELMRKARARGIKIEFFRAD